MYPETYSHRRGPWIGAAAAVGILLAVSVVTLRQPPEGSVSGSCLDARTGKPIAGASVSLSRHGDSDSDAAGAAPDEDHSDSHPDDKAAPRGWSQQTEDDSTLDAAGVSPHARDYLQTTTDSRGRFRFMHVRAGVYDLSGNRSDYNDSGPNTVAVEEGRVTRQTLSLTLADPTLDFERVMITWAPGARATLGLHGRLIRDRQVKIQVQSFDVEGALKQAPSQLVTLPHDAPESGYNGAQQTTWPGKYRLVRQWIEPIHRAAHDGSFYQRVALDGLAPGTYRVIATTAGKDPAVNSVGWIRITRLALVCKSYQGKALAMVTDLLTGRPVSGVLVALYDESSDSSRVLSRARTSPDGLAQVSASGADAESQGVLVARSGGSAAAVSLELNSPGSTGDSGAAADSDANSGSDSTTAASVPASDETLRAFLYTDRPIYRPGQTVDLKGIFRWFRRGSGFVVPANQPVSLDVRDGQNNLVEHRDLHTNDMGSWNTSLALSDDALTGEYAVRASLGDQHADGSFTVAAYHKPEYEVKVTLDKNRYIHGDTIHAAIHAAYYFGAPLSGQTVSYSVYKTDADDAGIGDETADASADGSPAGEPDKSGSATLDDSGAFVLDIPTHPEKRKGEAWSSGLDEGDQSYLIQAEVDDRSGNNVKGQATAEVAQGEFSLQATTSMTVCRPRNPVEATFEAVKADGSPLAGQDLEVQWAYEAWKDGQQTFQALQSSHSTTGADGTVHQTLSPPRAGLLIVRARGADRRGNWITSEGEVWAGADMDDNLPVQYPDLSLVLDQHTYGIGDTAHVLINTGHPGPSALLTLEGESLYHAYVVPLRKKSTSIDIPVTEELAPGVTLSVCCIRNSQLYTSSEKLSVDDHRRSLTVAVSPDRTQCLPGDRVLLHVTTRDSDGRPVPAEVSVGVVDSAIYAIQPEPAGTIEQAFLPDQGDSVSTSNSCDRLYLGDVDKGAASIKIRQRFPDTALWLPDLRTGSDGTAVVPLNLPDNLTTWRVTCYGHTLETAVGKGTCSVVVNKPLLARLETPNFLTAGDHSTLVALIHNNTPASLHAQVQLVAPGLSVEGPAEQEVEVTPGTPARLAWPITAGDPGSIPITLTAKAGSLSDGVQQSLEIAPHGSIRESWQSGTLLHHIDKTVTVELGALPGSTTLFVRLTPTACSALLPAVDYLAAYPYGSTDATTSVLISDCALAAASRASAPGPPPQPSAPAPPPQPSPAAGPVPGVTPLLSAPQRKRLDGMIQRSLLRLYRFQNDDGGWGWWQINPSDLWMTANATWGLTLARDAGYPVRDPVVSAAAKSTADLSQKLWSNWRSWMDPAPGALAALALARAGSPKNAEANVASLEQVWRKEPASQTCVALAQAALAEESAGDHAHALTLMGVLWSARRVTGTLSGWPAHPHFASQGLEQEPTDVDATAWAVLAAETISPADPRIESAVLWLMANRTGDHWSSTSTTAAAILALAKNLAGSHELQPDFTATLRCNGTVVRTVQFGADSIDRPDVLITLPGTGLKNGPNTITLDKLGRGRLYYSLDLRQTLAQPAAPPPPPPLIRWMRRILHPGEQTLSPTPSGFRIKRVYLRLTSRRGVFWEDSVPCAEQSYHPDEDVLVRLIVDSTRAGSHLMIEEPIPAGFTVTDTSADEASDWNNWWDYTDVRDDRIVFFIGDLTRGEHEIDYHLQARTPGVYDVMPAMLTGTFDPTFHASGAASRLWVDNQQTRVGE